MGTSHTNTGKRGEAGGATSELTEALRLAKREARRSWISYPLTGLLLLFAGIFAVPSLSGVFAFDGFGAGGERLETFCNAFFSDYLFLVVCAFLAATLVSGESTPDRRSATYSGFVILRHLAVPAGSVVGSRALRMLLALALNIPAPFLPTVLFSDLGDLGSSYLWFCGVWIGYGLLASGLLLLLDLTVENQTRALVFFGILTSITLALLEWTMDLHLVERTAALAQSYGPLAAALSLAGGFVALFLLARTTARRLAMRTLPENAPG